MYSTAGLQVCLDAGEPDQAGRAAGRPCTRWGRRCWPRSPPPAGTPAATPAGPPPGWPPGWPSTRPGPARSGRRPGPTRTRSPPGREYALAAPLLCVRDDGPDWTAPAGVTFADWIAGALPRPAHHRRPGLPPQHAVPAGPPARLPGGPLPGRPARPGVDRRRSRCWPRCSPTPAPTRTRRPSPRRSPTAGTRAARYGLADPAPGRGRGGPARPGPGGPATGWTCRPAAARRSTEGSRRRLRRRGEGTPVTDDRATGHGGRAAAHPDRRELDRTRARTAAAHRGGGRRRPDPAALAADVAAGLGPGARRQPGGALAGPRRRRPRPGPPATSTTCTTRSSIPARTGRRCRCCRRPRPGPTCARSGTRCSTCSTGIRFAERPLVADGFAFGMIVQHEQQHDETMLATHQLRAGAAGAGRAAAAAEPRARVAGEVLVPAGPFTMGTSTDPWALDNERPAHPVDAARVRHRRRAGDQRRTTGSSSPTAGTTTRAGGARRAGSTGTRPG